jgi:nucleoid-associated protein YgaU
MSLRRLAATTAVMAGAAVLLAALTPELPDVTAVRNPQALADTAGPDALVLAGAALLAWLAWGWGVLGLVLTALSAAPGVLGAVARGAGRLLLPAGARHAAAVALGLGLAVGSGTLAGCSTPAEPVAAAVELAPPVPDWPSAGIPDAAPGTAGNTGTTAPGPAVPEDTVPDDTAPDDTVPVPPVAGDGPSPVPDWPAGEHVVVRGECLWDIAAADLHARTGHEPAPTEITRAVGAWWAANAEVIGRDPDLLLPGQVLRAPASPTDPSETRSPR